MKGFAEWEIICNFVWHPSADSHAKAAKGQERKDTTIIKTIIINQK